MPRRPGHSLEEWVDSLPLFFASNTAVTGDVSRAVARGLLRKAGPRLYTTDLKRSLDELVVANAIKVASLRFPGAVISHRSALEMAPANGLLYLTGNYENVDRLPGLTIRQVRGPGPMAADGQVMTLYRASDARAYLENLRRTRRVGGTSRVLPRADLERRLEALLGRSGEDALNRLRDRARALAPALGAETAFAELDAIIAALLRSREAELEAPTAVARASGSPFDELRVQLFEQLAAELRRHGGADARTREPMLSMERQNYAFVDAYFSNYIEGTQFEVSEAREIVFEGKVPRRRPADAHDVLGTFELLVDRTEMGVSAIAFEQPEDFEELLQRRHVRIMAARPEAGPGEFKEVANRAGNTLFVAPDRVRGTLERGFEILVGLDTPFQRAAFAMFLVAEVHPFSDGNGRLARAIMNAELIAGEQSPILIVTSYREDYVGALRRLSRQHNPVTYVRMLEHAWKFTSRLDFADIDALLVTLKACNAFDDKGGIMRLPPKPPLV